MSTWSATPPAVATVYTTTATSAAGGATLRGRNTARRGVIIQNNGSTILYVLYDLIGGPNTVSATVNTVAIPVGGYWTMPTPIYPDMLSGIWAGNPTGQAVLTELT